MLELSCPGTGAVAGSMVARVNVQKLSCAAALHSGPQDATSDQSNLCITSHHMAVASCAEWICNLGNCLTKGSIRFITLHYSTVHYSTVHYSTLHYI